MRTRTSQFEEGRSEIPFPPPLSLFINLEEPQRKREMDKNYAICIILREKKAMTKKKGESFSFIT